MLYDTMLPFRVSHPELPLSRLYIRPWLSNNQVDHPQRLFVWFLVG
jgi:hypothetical protein